MQGLKSYRVNKGATGVYKCYTVIWSWLQYISDQTEQYSLDTDSRGSAFRH